MLAVQCLTSFIEAHEYAQQKFLDYLHVDNVSQSYTAEKQKVVQENIQVLHNAKDRLATIDHGVVVKSISKQSARWVLHAEENLIQELHEEGKLKSFQYLLSI